MVVCAIVLLSPEVRDGVALSRMPAALRAPPELLGWAIAHVPIGPALARLAQAVLVAGAISGLVGFYARASLALVTLSGLYLLGITQLTGTVLHDMHLLWFTALLAASPCGDSLSADAYLAGTASTARAAYVYAWPLMAARILLGAVYFFPGFWKLADAGLPWAMSDNLRNQMYWKWFQWGGFVPPLRVDHAPALLHAGGLVVIAFELSFVVLAVVPRLRVVALVLGLSFHFFTQVFLRIPFVSLWGCYVVLFDAHGVVGRIRHRGRAAPEVVASSPRTPPGALFSLLAASMIAGAVVQGARHATFAWPFACYPTFQFLAGPEMPDLLIEAVDAEGNIRVVPEGRSPGGVRTQRRWGTVWHVAGVTGPRPTPAVLRAYYDDVRAEPRVVEATRGARRLIFSRAYFSVLPEARGLPPTRKVPLGELAL